MAAVSPGSVTSPRAAPASRRRRLIPPSGSSSAAEGAEGLERALDDLFRRAAMEVERGANLIILSHRGVDAKFAPIPSLLATAGLHHHMVREGITGPEARERSLLAKAKRVRTGTTGGLP